MTSVLYSAGLNYQTGNPVRQEIVAVRREVDSLRKQLEAVLEENLIYRKHLMKLSQNSEEGVAELTQDLMALSSNSNQRSLREAGGGTVQGGGFRR
jgi:selenocysteine-specific translation elongation factor